MIRMNAVAVRLAGLGLAAVLGGAAVQAADLYERGARVPYDDPRYAYLYGREGTKPPPGWAPRRYGERSDPPHDPARLWKHRRAETHPGAWRDRYRHAGRRKWSDERRNCTPKDVVRRRLQADGWSGFANPKLIGERYVTAEARHEDGGKYRITLERCTGHLVDAERIGKRRRYADRDRDFFDRFDRDDWRRRPYAWRDDRNDRYGRYDDRFDRFARPRGRF